MNSPDKARVAIGLPCYNRPELLDQAVTSLRQQTFADISILISDNASTDEAVAKIARRHANEDARVRYVRQTVNLGISSNFAYVLEHSDAPLFMWASDDDVWEPTFIATLVDMLDSDPVPQMTCATVDNIDNNGHCTRIYPGFSRFKYGNNRVEDGLRYVAEGECLGKANIIHGLFRTAALKSVFTSCWNDCMQTTWGADQVFNFSFVSRFPITGTDAVLLHKRLLLAPGKKMPAFDPRVSFVPNRDFRSYLNCHVRVAPDRKAAKSVQRLLWRRFWLKKYYKTMFRLSLLERA